MVIAKVINHLPGRSYEYVELQSQPLKRAPDPTSLKSKFHRYIKSVGWLRRLFVTKDGEVVIAQWPNAPLIVAFVADGTSFVSHGQIKSISTWVAQIAFVIWAIMEIGWGVNPFRRILGAIVFALMGFAIFRRLV
jgi:hypothetical protein